MTTTPDPTDAQGDPQKDEAAAAAAPKKRKRRKWPWVLLGLVVLLLLLVLLAPTLISTGPVRSLIASQASNYINGSVKIGDLSLGWMSGTRVGGVKIYDDKGVLILELDQLKTDLSLLDAIKGNYALGETIVDANLAKCTVYEDGTTNYQKLVKQTPKEPQPKPQKQPAKESKLPDVSGNITVKYRGTIDGPGVPEVIHVDPSSAVVKITNINQPISNDLKLAYRLGNSPSASVSFAGTVDAIENNRVLDDPTKFVADQKLQLTDVNLAAAEPVLKKGAAATQPTTVGGIANGTITLKADGKNSASADGAIAIANLLFGGGPLSGDIYKSSKLNLPINITATALDGGNTLVKIQKLAIETDHATLNVNGQVTRQALQNVAAQKKPGAPGNIALVVDVPKVGELANQLPHMLKLQQGVKITQGILNATTKVDFTPDNFTVAQTARVEAAGTNNGKPVKLDPVELKNLAATITPTGQSIPDVQNIALELISAFATAKTSGPNQSLSNLAIAGDLNLDKAYQQLVQFSDLGGMKLAGAGTFNVASQGDLTKPGGTAKASFGVDLKNLVVSGLKDRPDVNQPHLATTASATLVRADEKSQKFLQSIKDVTVTTMSGDAQAPVLDLEAKVASLVLDPAIAAQQAQITKLNIPDLAKAQQQFGGFIPALKDFQVQQGQLYTNLSANYDGASGRVELLQPLSVSIRNLSLAKVGQAGQPSVQLFQRENFSVNVAGKVAMPKDGNIAADLSQLTVNQPVDASSLIKISNTKPIAVVVNPKGGITGNGTLQIVSDIKRLTDLQKAMATTQPAAGATAQAQSGQITSGQLNTTVTLEHPADAKVTTIGLDGAISNLSVTNSLNQPAIANETIKLALKANSPDDFSAVTVESGSVASSFATTKIDKTVVNLNATSVFDKLTQAALEVTVPDLPRAYALYTALVPPAPAPAGAQPAALNAPLPEMYAQATGSDPISVPKKKKNAVAPAAPAPAPDASGGAATTQPLPPLQVTSGAASMKLNVTRDPQKRITTIAAPTVTLTNLGIVRGDQKYEAPKGRAVNLQLTANVTTAPPPAPPTTQSITEQIERLEIAKLAGDLLVAQLQTQPITIQGLGTNKLSANGAVKVAGTLQELTPLLAVMQGKPAMTYAGKYDVNQSIATQQNQIVLKGNIAVPDFQTDAKSQPQNLAVNNDIVAENFTSDAPQKNLAINALTVAMPDSKALGLAINNAKITDVNNQRKFENFVAKVSYDLAQLWPIIKPMMSAEQQKTYEDMKIAGQYARDFHITGSYPANDPDPMKYMQMDGGFAVQQLSTNGMDISIPEQPFALKDGHLTTPTPPKPATCNGGTIDLGALDVWLRPEGALVSLPKKHPLMRGVQLNPVLADRLGSKANVIFKDATQAGGQVSVTINEFKSVPVTKITEHGSRAAGTITMTIENLKLDGQVTRVLSSVLQLGGQGIVGEIRDASIVLNDGFSKSDLPITIQRKGTPQVLRFSGTIDLATNQLMSDYVVNIPSGLLGSDELSKVMAGGIALPVKGTLSSWQVDTSRLLEAQAKASIGGLLGGGQKKDDGKAGSQEQPKQDNPLGGLLDQLTKPKDDSQSQPPAKKKKK